MDDSIPIERRRKTEDRHNLVGQEHLPRRCCHLNVPQHRETDTVLKNKHWENRFKLAYDHLYIL